MVEAEVTAFRTSTVNLLSKTYAFYLEQGTSHVIFWWEKRFSVWSFPSCSGKIGGWCFEIRKKFLALLIFGKKSPESSYNWAVDPRARANALY
jgi:hypothetical protein